MKSIRWFDTRIIWKPEDSITNEISASTTPSTLPRPPAGLVPPRTAIAVLESLAWKPLQLPGGDCLPLIRAVARAGVVGGPIYDAQIAATAKHHGLTLLSRDRRAATVYDLVGVDYELV